MIKNYMEDVVEHYLPTLLSEYDNICKCDKCIDDIKALALNNLKPLYYVTDKGRVYVKTVEFIMQFKVDAVNELTRAINKVAQNVKHDEEFVKRSN